MAKAAPIEITVKVELSDGDRDRLDRWSAAIGTIPEAVQSAQAYGEKKRAIAQAVGKSLDYRGLEEHLQDAGILDELDGIWFGNLNGSILVEGVKDGEIVAFNLVVDL